MKAVVEDAVKDATAMIVMYESRQVDLRNVDDRYNAARLINNLRIVSWHPLGNELVERASAALAKGSILLTDEELRKPMQ